MWPQMQTTGKSKPNEGWKEREEKLMAESNQNRTRAKGC